MSTFKFSDGFGKSKNLNIITTIPSYFVVKYYGDHHKQQINRYIQKVMGSCWNTDSLLKSFKENNYVPTILIHGDESNILELKNAVAAINTLFYINHIDARVYTGQRCAVEEYYNQRTGQLSFSFKY